MMLTSSRRKQGMDIQYISKERRCTTVNSHVSSSESNNPNASNSDNSIGNLNLPHINVQTENSFEKIITLKKRLIQSQVLV